MKNKGYSRRISLLSVLFFCLTLSIYMLSYQGIPVSDDEHLFASAAQTLAVYGELGAPQLYGNDRVQGEYKGSGPVHSLLASIVIRLARWASVGQLQALYFLSPLYTALTAALLFYHILKQGYGLGSTLAAGILFCLGSIAWPYSQTFFREPLAMLLLTLSWLSLTAAVDKKHSQPTRAVAWAGFGISFAAALLTKVLLIVLIPAYLVILWRAWSVGTPKLNSMGWMKIIYILAAVLLVIALMWAMNSLQLLDINTRLTLRFFERLWRFRGEYPYEQIPGALLGMLFSPGKGLLVYAPWVVLAFIPSARHSRREKDHSIFALLALAGLLMGQATAYGSEWWNTTWGTRFLLPVFPFLILAVLPWIDRGLSSNKRWPRYTLVALIGVSILIQLGGVLVSNATYAADLYLEKDVPDIGLTIWQFRHAPLIQHWRLLFSGLGPNLAAWRIFPHAGVLVAVSLALCLAVAVISLAWLKSLPHRRLFVLLPLITIFLVPALMLAAYKNDPHYGAWRLDILEAEKHLNENAQEGDVLLIYPYLGTDWYYFINFYGGELPWYSLPPDYPITEEDTTTDLILSLYESYARVWLLVEITPAESATTHAFETLTYFGQLGDDRMWELYGYPRQVRLSLFELVK
ncbi:MAG: hypothetical protein PVF83_04880 [Anaerolineales bacterium]